MKKRLKEQVLWQICQYLIKEQTSIFTRKNLIEELDLKYQTLIRALKSMLKRDLILIYQNEEAGGKFHQIVYRSKLPEIEAFLRYERLSND